MQSAASAEEMLGILSLSGGDFILLVLLLLILFGFDEIIRFLRGSLQGTNQFRRALRKSGQRTGESLGAGLGKPVADALTHSNRTCEFQDPPALRLRQIRKQMKNAFILWIAQGFGVGRIPFAPGTFGSLVGLLWLAMLLLPGNPWFGLGGMLAALFLSVWLCGAAEKILNRTDPGSVVLDEIVAVPLCFAVWVCKYLLQHGVLPGLGYFFNRDAWPLTLAVFAAFRLFDVIKPWPLRQSQ